MFYTYSSKKEQKKLRNMKSQIITQLETVGQQQASIEATSIQFSNNENPKSFTRDATRTLHIPGTFLLERVKRGSEGQQTMTKSLITRLGPNHLEWKRDPTQPLFPSSPQPQQEDCIWSFNQTNKIRKQPKPQPQVFETINTN